MRLHVVWVSKQFTLLRYKESQSSAVTGVDSGPWEAITSSVIPKLFTLLLFSSFPMLVTSCCQNDCHSLSKHAYIHTSKRDKILFLLLRRKCFPWSLQMAYHFCSLARSEPHGQAQLWGTVRKRLSYFQRLHNRVWRGMRTLGITNCTKPINSM